MIDIRKIKEQQKDIHPGFGSYLECMTRGLFTGLSGFCLCKFFFFISKHVSCKNQIKKKIDLQPSPVFILPKKLVKTIYHTTRNLIFLCVVLLEQ